VPRTQTVAESLGQLRVNDLVRVNVAGRPSWGGGEAAEEVRSRVEEVIGRCAEHGQRYVIAAPRYAGDVEVPDPATPCTLEWPGPHGIWVLPVEFVDEQVVGQGLRVWVTEVMSPPRQNERRTFCRVEWDLPLTVAALPLDDVRRIPSGTGAATMAQYDAMTVRGHTRNLSEGGVRCRLPGPGLPVGVGVMVEVEIAGESFTLAGRVQWVRPTGMHGADAWDTAISFDEPARHGDRLRPLLFAEQLRLRRAGLE